MLMTTDTTVTDTGADSGTLAGACFSAGFGTAVIGIAAPARAGATTGTGEPSWAQ